jgi:O-antigen/teichoic acid export membrane protein
MSVGRRVISGTLANTASIGMNALLQLLTVPVLVNAWGAEQFGLWMMLTTIPTYFALTDLGFVQASTSDMTMQVANGDRKKATATFQSSLLLIGAMCCAAAAVVVSLTQAWSHWVMPLDYAGLIGLLAVFAALSLFSRMSLCSLLATGHYALGTIVYNCLLLVEGLAGLLTAFLGGGFAEVAQCLLAMRFVNMVTIYCLARHKVEWLQYGIGQASMAEVKRLLKPALAAMTIPLALAINLQGVVLIIGTVLSPAAVAIYTPVRTCSRLLIQVIGVVNRASMPELAKASALSDGQGLGQILRLNGFMVAAVLLPGSVAFAVLGRDFVEFWSAGHIAPDHSFIALLALATFIHGCWYFTSNILLATNSHVPFAKFSLVASIVTLLLVLLLSRVDGLDGAGLALLMGETLCMVAVMRIFFSNYRTALWGR